MKRIHMMGISGSGMSGVASLASKMGYIVTGCDLKSGGHDASHLKDVDLLVVSPAVLYQSKSDPELVEGKKKGIVMTWEEFLGSELVKNKKVIAIAGTHGKSTTTAMVSKILIDNGFDPSVVIGAYVPEWGGNSRFGKGEYFVIEADEFNDNFLNYYPDIIVINNIEFDHPDYFKDEKQLKESFDKFIKNLNPNGKLITSNLSLQKKFNLHVFGEHNQKNANMAYLVGRQLKIKSEEIIKSLESFRGIGRRMEEISPNVFDDYAHHPTAIKTTLEGLREKFSNKKILAVIEPHGYKRTKALLPLYKNAFDSVDSVIIGPIYKARDVVDKSISISDMARTSRHPDIQTFEKEKDLIPNLEFRISNFHVVVVMGAGNSNQWAKEIARIKNGTSFKDITTIKVGGKIKYYFEVKNKQELEEKIKFAKDRKLPVFTIGGGSDIAASDNDFNGVVVKYVGNRISYIGDKVTAEAGVSWDELVEDTVKKGLKGIESLSGIPGTVGASPIQNIGAYGQELADTFVELTAYDIENQKFKKLNKIDCKFGYRTSIFKTKDYWQKFIITDITLKLSKGNIKELQRTRNDILSLRNQKLENPDSMPNAGSFFMNPFVDLKTKEKLEKEYPDMKFYQTGNLFKVSAGYLIEKSGWKGKSLGPVKVSDKHALIVTNPEGKGNFKDIKNISDAIIKDVYKKFKIKLVPEVQYINI